MTLEDVEAISLLRLWALSLQPGMLHGTRANIFTNRRAARILCDRGLVTATESLGGIWFKLTPAGLIAVHNQPNMRRFFECIGDRSGPTTRRMQWS